MSGEKCYPTFQFFLNLFYTLTCFGRNFKTGIADGSIEIDKSVQIVKLILIISICFIKDYLNGYAVCLSRSQKAVDESSGGFRIIDRNNKHALVKVGSKDMRLFRKIGSSSDNVVFPVFYFLDESSSFRIQDNLHIISHSYRIGTAYAFETEVTFDFTLHTFPLVGLYQIPTTCIFYYQSPQFNCQLKIDN